MTSDNKPFLHFISDRTSALLGLLIGILGIFLSLILYVQSIAEPDLSYATVPVRTTVLRSGQTNKLKIYFEDSLVSTDLTAAQLYVWNAGRKPILASDLLEPIIISTSDKSKILEVRVIGMTRPTTGVVIYRIPSSENAFQLDFRILERGDGVKIQVLYQGNASVSFLAAGQLIGQNSIRDATFGSSREDSWEPFIMQPWYPRMIGGAMFFSALVFAFLEFRRKKMGNKETIIHAEDKLPTPGKRWHYFRLFPIYYHWALITLVVCLALWLLLVVRIPPSL